MRRWILIGVSLLASAAWPIGVRAAEQPRVREIEGLRVVWLSGSPFELGRQHGMLLREEVRASLRNTLGFFRRYLKVPLIRSLLVNWWLDSTWGPSARHVPEGYLEELRGLAEGAGVPLRELHRLHAVPDRTYACANLAAWGRATGGGRLVHLRNLDWNIKAGVQRYAIVFVVRPTGTRAFINVGWAGFIGVLTGINERGISIGQVGAESADVTDDGEPMVFLMRRVLEHAADLDHAADLIRTARRTVGVNYVIADAGVGRPGRAGRAIAIETTARHVRVFEADDPAESQVEYARPIADAVFRADTAMDPVIRERQMASMGDPTRPGLEPPGGSAYEVRYRGQAAGIEAQYGRMDAERAQALAQAIAPDSNVQSVIFAWPEIWIANAEGTIPAARTAYHPLDARALFGAE